MVEARHCRRGTSLVSIVKFLGVRNIYTAKEIAEMQSVTVWTVKYWIRQGKLKAHHEMVDKTTMVMVTEEDYGVFLKSKYKYKRRKITDET